eukprot:gene16093-biopygen5241
MYTPSLLGCREHCAAARGTRAPSSAGTCASRGQAVWTRAPLGPVGETARPASVRSRSASVYSTSIVCPVSGPRPLPFLPGTLRGGGG